VTQKGSRVRVRVRIRVRVRVGTTEYAVATQKGSRSIRRTGIGKSSAIAARLGRVSGRPVQLLREDAPSKHSVGVP
jgi:hypothetical protein